MSADVVQLRHGLTAVVVVDPDARARRLRERPWLPYNHPVRRRARVLQRLDDDFVRKSVEWLANGRR